MATKPTKIHERKRLYMGNEKIIEKDLVFEINKCVFEVYRVLGHGFLEKI